MTSCPLINSLCSSFFINIKSLYLTTTLFSLAFFKIASLLLESLLFPSTNTFIVSLCLIKESFRCGNNAAIPNLVTDGKIDCWLSNSTFDFVSIFKVSEILLATS